MTRPLRRAHQRALPGGGGCRNARRRLGGGERAGRDGLAFGVLGWALLALAVIDARALILPDVLTWPLAACGLATAWLLDAASLAAHVIDAVAGWLGLWLVARIYAALRHRRGLGAGDAKLMAAAGAWLGWQGLPSVLLIGSLGALAALALAAMLRRPVTASTVIPFGPFLAFGLWLTWLYGPVAVVRLAGAD